MKSKGDKEIWAAIHASREKGEKRDGERASSTSLGMEQVLWTTGKRECREGSEHGAEPGRGRSGWQHGCSAAGRKRLEEKPRRSLGWAKSEHGVGKQGVMLRVAWEVPGAWKTRNRDEHMLILKCGAGVRSLRYRRSRQAGGRGGRQGLLAHVRTWEGNLVLANSVLLCCLKAEGRASHSCLSLLPLVPTYSRTLWPLQLPQLVSWRDWKAAGILEMSQQCQVMRFSIFWKT